MFKATYELPKLPLAYDFDTVSILKVLAKAGFVKKHKKGKRVYYINELLVDIITVM